MLRKIVLISLLSLINCIWEEMNSEKRILILKDALRYSDERKQFTLLGYITQRTEKYFPPYAECVAFFDLLYHSKSSSSDYYNEAWQQGLQDAKVLIDRLLHIPPQKKIVSSTARYIVKPTIKKFVMQIEVALLPLSFHQVMLNACKVLKDNDYCAKHEAYFKHIGGDTLVQHLPQMKTEEANLSELTTPSSAQNVVKVESIYDTIENHILKIVKDSQIPTHFVRLVQTVPWILEMYIEGHKVLHFFMKNSNLGKKMLEITATPFFELRRVDEEVLCETSLIAILESTEVSLYVELAKKWGMLPRSCIVGNGSSNNKVLLSLHESLQLNYELVTKKKRYRPFNFTPSEKQLRIIHIITQIYYEYPKILSLYPSHPYSFCPLFTDPDYMGFKYHNRYDNTRLNIIDLWQTAELSDCQEEKMWPVLGKYLKNLGVKPYPFPVELLRMYTTPHYLPEEKAALALIKPSVVRIDDVEKEENLQNEVIKRLSTLNTQKRDFLFANIKGELIMSSDYVPVDVFNNIAQFYGHYIVDMLVNRKIPIYKGDHFNRFIALANRPNLGLICQSKTAMLLILQEKHFSHGLSNLMKQLHMRDTKMKFYWDFMKHDQKKYEEEKGFFEGWLGTKPYEAYLSIPHDFVRLVVSTLLHENQDRITGFAGLFNKSPSLTPEQRYACLEAIASRTLGVFKDFYKDYEMTEWTIVENARQYIRKVGLVRVCVFGVDMPSF